MLPPSLLAIAAATCASSAALSATRQAPAPAQPPAPAKPGTPAPTSPVPKETAVQLLTKEAALLEPLVASPLAKAFLAATASLPEPPARALWRNRETGDAFTQAEYDALPGDKKDALAKRDYDARFYYYTGYGSPLVYARPLDLLAQVVPDAWSKTPAGKRILDFGYGTIGHLRLLASLGADVTGIEVEPLFQKLYAAPEDTGSIHAAAGGADGKLRILLGRWPADEAVAKAAGEGGGYDLFISKNTLKRGYIHPAREADPKRLVHLGVDDAAFCKHVFDSLKPGGIFLIYNISPAQAPADKPYIPHADGQCPFDRVLLERTGFEVLRYDTEDRDAVLKWWMALGYNSGKPEDEAKKDLFAWCTIARRPAAR